MSAPAASPAPPQARTGLGDARGTIEDGCPVFRRVPYAAPPVAALRFAPARAPAPWTTILDCTEHGPVAPQPPSDLCHYMGDFDRPQGEDCLTLTIWTPGADARRRPVLLWFHGGAYVSGAGSLDWYSGARLALAGDIVVVHANYRLGALGWLCWPGLAEGNLGLSDQARALRWVLDHVAAFGGDPGCVTVGGQSAGASTTTRLLLDPETRSGVRRALLQSGGFGRTPTSRTDAEPTARVFLTALGIDPAWPDAADRLLRAPVAEILAAQAEAERFGFTLPVQQQAWRPILDGHPSASDYTRSVGQAAAAEGVDLLVGFTRDEGHAFVGGPIPADVDRALVVRRFEALTGDPEALGRYEAALPGAGNAELLAELTSHYQYIRGSLEIADAAAEAGGRVHVYRFDWTPPGAPFGAGHCLDLAFVFGIWPSWAGAPMLAGGEIARMEALGRVMRRALASFVRTGEPVYADRQPWPSYDSADRRILQFGHRVETV